MIRAGDRPCCVAWGHLSKVARSWDCYVNYFGAAEQALDFGQEHTFRDGVSKYFGLADYFDASPQTLQRYDAFLLLDDDIEIGTDEIDRFFTLFREHRLQLAQPSLHPESFANHAVTVHQPNNLLRYTRFVEIMMPAFTQAALAACLPTFRDSVSGWGLDYMWPGRLSYPDKGIAIVDAIQARHTKQSDPRGGAFYRMLEGMGVDAHDELDRIVRAHGIDVPYSPSGLCHCARARTVGPDPAPSWMVCSFWQREAVISGVLPGT